MQPAIAKGLEVDLRRYGATSYRELYERFTWHVPEWFNISTACLDRHVASDSPALLEYDRGTSLERRTSFRELRDLASRLQAGLSDLGIGVGDRICLLLDPGLPLTVAMHGVYRLGAIVVSMSTLLGPEAIKYRMRDSAAAAIVYEAELRDRLASETDAVQIVADGQPREGEHTLGEFLQGSRSAQAVPTRADDAGHMYYTSGTTGPPKGALHAHRYVLGHVPAWQMYFEFAPRPDDVFWTPAEWAWIGALGDLVLPAWYFGAPVVATKRRKFDPSDALEILANYGVTCAFMPPTALRMLMKSVEDPRRQYQLRLRCICSGGEKVTPELIRWADEQLGAHLNQLYGQTEANVLLANHPGLHPIKPEATGVPTPGFMVGIVNDRGEPLPTGTIGQIALRAPHPIVFLEYWGKPEKTREKFTNGWVLTGDMGYVDPAGYFYFVSRSDDLIKTAGYRVGPEEVETEINRDPAVLESAVIPKEDPVRGHIIKAFVVLRPGHAASEQLRSAIITAVKGRLAAYAYPREIEFVDEIPKTSTGKLQRFLLRQREGRELKPAAGAP